MISIIPLMGIPRISHGDSLGPILAKAAEEHFPLTDNDCLVVASKVVAKSLGCVVTLTDTVTKDDIIASESQRILRRRGPVTISETHHGFICANAGIDESNTQEGTVITLPRDIDGAAHAIRMSFLHESTFDIPVIVSDTFGRPFRMGETNIAVGYSGMKSFADLKGTKDLYGRELNVTAIAIADEIAGAAELVMHKDSGVCAAIVRGLPASYRGKGKASELVRPSQDDLFR